MATMTLTQPPAFSSASLIGAFLSSGKPIAISKIPEPSKRWIDMVSDPRSSTILAESHQVGKLEGLFTTDQAEAALFYQKWNMGPLPLSTGREVYLAAMFACFVKWTRKVKRVVKKNRDYLSFGNLDIIIHNGRPVGAMLPVDNSQGLYVWAAMPDSEITTVDQLQDFVTEIESARRQRLIPKVPTFVPPVTLRSDMENKPPLIGTEVSIDGGPTVPIVDTKFSYRLVLNDKGAFMRAVTGIVVTAISIPTIAEFVIDRPFVFAAGTQEGGILFASYIPEDYWIFTSGTGDEALRDLDAAAFGTYRPKAGIVSRGAPIVFPQPSIVTDNGGTIIEVTIITENGESHIYRRNARGNMVRTN